MVQARNAVEGLVYRHVMKPWFFRHDPEVVHDGISHLTERLAHHTTTRGLLRLAFDYRHPMLEQAVLGVRFPNPIGLSAGFDKNGRLTQAMPAIGFGFMEIGSVTGEACAGNPKPRLWRLPESKSLVVNYGLMNDGAEAIAARLRGQQFAIPVGISVAKTNSRDTVPTEAGVADYVKAYRAVSGLGSYYTINISCPNTFGGQPFTDPERLETLLSALDQAPHTKPVLVKFSPDLSEAELDGLLEVAVRHNVQGFICSNLTKRRDNPRLRDAEVPSVGGLSGKVQAGLSDAQVRQVYRKAGRGYVVIGSGGVFSAEDAYRKIRAGASLVQLITGMIYEGPQQISEINAGLVRLLRRDGFKNVAQAVGTAV